jgi:MFS family permease
MRGMALKPAADSPLRYADFRVLWLSGLLTGSGYAGETVVLGWLLLDRTDSPLVVASGIALRALPNLLLGIPGGALADRVDRRRLIRVVTTVTALVTATLGLLQLAGVLGVALILAGTFVGGCSRALGQTARSSYAFDIVGPARVVSGTALMSLAQRAGSVAGSAGVGLLLGELGAGEAYLALASAHLISAIVLLWAHTSGQAAPLGRPPVLEGVREFIGEIGHNRKLALLVMLTAAVEVVGFSHQSLLPSVARDVLGIGADGLGLLTAFGSAAAMFTVLFVSTRGEVRHSGLLFLLVLLLFGAALVMLGLSGTVAVALVAVAVVMSMAALSDLLSQSLVQSAVPNDLRGRAMGSWLLAIGLGPVGHLQIGALAALAGVTTALVTNGLLLVLLAAGTLIGAKSIRRPQR